MTKRKIASIGVVLTLGVAACSPVGSQNQTVSAAATSQASKPDANARSFVSGLAGEWRVAGIDGQPFNEPYGLALTGDADKIWWEPRCAGMARGYRITGTAISVSSLDPPRAPGEATPPVCTIGLPPRLSEVFRALDSAETIERTPENGIHISGGGHSLTMFSQ